MIADDFTGALDSGVQFAARGARTRVVTDPAYDFSQAEEDLQVLVLDAETRHLTPEAAYGVVFRAVEGALKNGFTYIYKKTDSALRGNVGAELTAVLDAAGADSLAGLNPHCGENGMFGQEEIEEIQPAIDQAMAEGIIIPEKKPTPPDTVFSKALGGWYDIVVVMYHDQGHIPLKVKGFVYNKADGHWDAVAGVNVTLGLPIIRASVDHGTGFGHAGDGHANELSLVNAMDYGIRMANAKAKP